MSGLMQKLARRSLREIWREAAHRARVELDLDRRLPAGRALAPYSLALWLTERCNLNCAMCWVKNKPRPELPLAAWLGFLDGLGAWRPRLTVTGGEPTLYRDLMPLLGAIKERGFYLSLNSNGLGAPELAAGLVGLGVNDVSLSLDGLEPYHDQVRGRRGAWQQSTQWLRELLRARGEGHLPVVRVVSVMQPDNLDQMADLHKQLVDWGVDCHTLQHRWFVTPSLLEAHQAVMKRRLGCVSPDLQGFLVDRPPALPGWSALREQLAASLAAGRAEFSPALEPDQVGAYYGEPLRPVRRACRSRWHRAAILPDGEVTPCLSFSAGNITSRSFPAIWNGPAMRAFRRELSRGGLFPGCLRCCGLFSDHPGRIRD